jgi:hypothetical protein
MKCVNHPDVESTGLCSSCSKPICAECTNNAAGNLICPQCLSMGNYPHPPQTSPNSYHTLAIASLVLCVLGLLGCGLCGALGPLLGGLGAVVTGFMARQQLSEPGALQKGKQMATIALILGVAEILLSVILLLVLGIYFGASLFSGLLSQ